MNLLDRIASAASVVTERGKAQEVRLVDVFVLGPLMLWFALRSRGMPEWSRFALGFAGVGTILYNARNYVRLSEAP